MHFSCHELEARFTRSLNEEQSQSDAFATFLMLCCCAINWLILSGPFGHWLPQPLHLVVLCTLAVGSLAVQVTILSPTLSLVYKRNRTLIMGLLRLVCNAVTTLTMPAYHCYLESNITNDTSICRIVHYLVDGMPIVPGFVALVFPLPFNAHMALLLAAHVHLVLSQWFDCITLVAYPVTGAAYRHGPLDVIAQPEVATQAVQLCRQVNIVGQAVMLVASGVYSWRQEHVHRWRFLKAAYDFNLAHGGDAERVATTQLKPIGPLGRWGQVVLFEVLVLCPLVWAPLYMMRSQHQLATGLAEALGAAQLDRGKF